MQGQNYNPYTGAPLSGIDPPAGYPQKSRIAAGLFGMLMGTFGVHNFYLGNTQRGLIQILVATLGAPLSPAVFPQLPCGSGALLRACRS